MMGEDMASGQDAQLASAAPLDAPDALARVKRRLAAGGNNGREVLSVINELEGVLNEQSRLLADVCDCMIKGGDGKPLTYGWKITGLNALRPRLLPFRRWGN